MLSYRYDVLAGFSGAHKNCRGCLSVMMLENEVIQVAYICSGQCQQINDWVSETG